ncbi:winged helix DNA-binding domain-containing protein [Pseudoxanthomonas indica]|uniref:Winged helix DNA-binding domain-containing protein n=1 Tax=Pseudoxanthomonas indica TaxID=428993 RepID=A0A1T5KSN3_9GAMM|nr:winged helix DNA-binding domain-containing protein [Pseudoxanthomonas indica]GGD51055.1 hypothetical protein GCM10007235_24020 [Pseudoxanthomonas indica]SKC66278.1 Winged helix DNA-binding domain-containing protein [Pseudoxanthomonas indica]
MARTSAASSLLARRLATQGVSQSLGGSVLESVRHLLAVQAQDHYASLWALGLRTRDADEATVERAVRDRLIVRSWPMRGTLHLVAAEDLRWMLSLMAARIIGLDRARIERDFGLHEQALGRCRDAVVRVLEGGRALSRPTLYAALAARGIDIAGPRGLQILGRLAHEGLICQGPREGKQPTFVLLDEWLAPQPTLDRDEALAMLARRYVAGHGPASVRDLAWWSGLTLSDAQRAWDLARSDLETLQHDGVEYAFVERGLAEAKPAIYLLPAFDEYLVGYADRAPMIPPQHHRRVVCANGLFNPTVIIGGRVAATWKRELRKDRVDITLAPLRALNASERKAIARAARDYGRFLGLPVQLDT